MLNKDWDTNNGNETYYRQTGYQKLSIGGLHMPQVNNKSVLVDQYIRQFNPEVQERLSKIRDLIKKAAPGAEETIAYQMPTYRLNGNLVHFAAFKNHIGFYPTPSGIDAFQQELADYKRAKGSRSLSTGLPKTAMCLPDRKLTIP